MANNIVLVELQAIAGTLQLVNNALNNVFASVTKDPGPIQNPQGQSASGSIVATSQAINTVAQQIQQIANGNPAGGGGGATGASSSIEVKKDVTYLDDAAKARLAEETMGIRLATYKYKNDDARERLGFILEDSPNVAAADMGKKQVDLYAYTSMVVATVQQQQAEIEALKAQVATLKKS